MSSRRTNLSRTSLQSIKSGDRGATAPDLRSLELGSRVFIDAHQRLIEHPALGGQSLSVPLLRLTLLGRQPLVKTSRSFEFSLEDRGNIRICHNLAEYCLIKEAELLLIKALQLFSIKHMK